MSDDDLLKIHRCGNCNASVPSLLNGLCDDCHAQTVVKAPDTVAPGQPTIAINIGQDGMYVQMPVEIPFPEELMNQIVRNWLKSHPALLLQIAAEAAAKEKRKSGIITDFRPKRLN